MTATLTVEDGQVAVFVAVARCSAACVGIHAALRGTRNEALEPVRQGVAEHFGGSRRTPSGAATVLGADLIVEFRRPHRPQPLGKLATIARTTSRRLPASSAEPHCLSPGFALLEHPPEPLPPSGGRQASRRTRLGLADRD